MPTIFTFTRFRSVPFPSDAAIVLSSVTLSPIFRPSFAAIALPAIACSPPSFGHVPLTFHHDRMPSTPTTVDSPESMCRVLANHVPTIGTFAALQLPCVEPEQPASAWMFSSGAKLVMLNAQKMVLIFFASDSFKNDVGSEEEVPEAAEDVPEAAEPLESPVPYRSLTTASDFG